MKAIRNATLISLAVAALALVAVAPAAYADTTPLQTVTMVNATDNLTNELVSPVLLQFNNISGIYAGDTLNSVTITFVGSGTTTLTATNSDLVIPSTAVEVDSTTTVTLNSTNGSINSLLTTNNFKDSMTASVSGQTVSPSTTATWGPSAMSSAGGKTATFSSGLGAFIGLGDLGLELNSSTHVLGGGTGGSLTTGQEDNGSGGTITVEYDYSPPSDTPEPGTLTLFGTGLLGLAGMLRRKFMLSR